MSKSLTLEERCIIKIYEISKEAGDMRYPFESSVLEKAMGITDKKARNILNQLAQANFIRKKGTEFHISEQGICLVKRLLGIDD